MTGSDFIHELGPLALALRLKRLAERIHEDGRRVYAAISLPLEPSWYAHLLLLAEAGPLSITQIAAALGQKHPSVVVTARKLQEAGLVTASEDPTDRRGRKLALTERTRELWPRFREVWDAFRDELRALTAEVPSDFIGAVAAIEDRLAQTALDARVLARLEAPPRKQRRRSATANTDVSIRPVAVQDENAVLHIARELVRAADTYAFDPDVSDEQLWAYWAPPKPSRGFVALRHGQVVGMFVIRPNHPGPAAHVANASYAVRGDVRGLGLGRRMGEASLDIARELGYGAMQFNIVVATNTYAIQLWKSLGYEIIGTVPEGFRRPDGSLVAHYIMYRRL